MKSPPLIGLITPTFRALLVIALVTGIGALSPFNHALEYQAGWWSAGELWRPVTAWISQLNPQHWLINQWGLVLMAMLLPTRLERMDWLALGWVWLAASIALAFSDYRQYAGLSGLLYGWLLWSLARSPHYAAWIKWGIAAVLTIKVGYENLPGLAGQGDSYVSRWIQADVAVRSHAWGLVAGWLAVMALGIASYRKRLQADG